MLINERASVVGDQKFACKVFFNLNIYMQTFGTPTTAGNIAYDKR